MTDLTPLARNQLVSALATNGFHAECASAENWVAADATFAPGRCFVTRGPQADEFLVGASLAQVADALVDEQFERAAASCAPPDIATDIFHVIGEAALHQLVRRIFQLSIALPTAPLDTFCAQTRNLPASTEAERLVVQRVGQDIFRAALLEYWSGCCAATGIDQTELLRASHCKPWSVSTDAERLNVHNGFPFVADVDAAFDCGLISFDDGGAVILSAQLRERVRARFDGLQIQPAIRLTAAHRVYLDWHRQFRFKT